MHLLTISLFSLLSTALASVIPQTTLTNTIIPRAEETAPSISYYTSTKTIIIDGITEAHVTIPAKTIEIAIPTCVQSSTPDENGHIPPGECGAIWKYYPNFGAAVAFALVFATLIGVHIWQAFRYRKIWCWVIVMAATWETIVYVLRAVSTKGQQNQGVYLAYQIFILVAPIWVNIFTQMVFGRMVYYFVPSRRILNTPALTLILLFVGLDVLVLTVQVVGASMASPGSSLDTQNRGIHIYIGGIAVQEFLILVLGGLCVQFQRVMRSIEGAAYDPRNTLTSPWGRLLGILYFSFAMMTVRTVYRLSEFSGGINQYNSLTTHEASFYFLETLPMLLTLVAFILVHPGPIMTGPQSDMPGLASMIKKKLARNQTRESLDDINDDEDQSLKVKNGIHE